MRLHRGVPGRLCDWSQGRLATFLNFHQPRLLPFLGRLADSAVLPSHRPVTVDIWKRYPRALCTVSCGIFRSSYSRWSFCLLSPFFNGHNHLGTCQFQPNFASMEENAVGPLGAIRIPFSQEISNACRSWDDKLFFFLMQEARAVSSDSAQWTETLKLPSYGQYRADGFRVRWV